MIKKFEEFVKMNEAIVEPVSSIAPTTKEELQEIIIQRIEEDGPECDLNDIDVSKIDDMSFLFSTVPNMGNKIFQDFNGDISGWDVSHVKDMTRMFYGCENFNGDISEWNVSNVWNMYGMFGKCKNFNQDISVWDVSGVEDMTHMFDACISFYEADKLEAWKDKLMDDVDTEDMFHGCPARPSWYNEEI